MVFINGPRITPMAVKASRLRAWPSGVEGGGQVAETGGTAGSWFMGRALATVT